MQKIINGIKNKSLKNELSEKLEIQKKSQARIQRNSSRSKSPATKNINIVKKPDHHKSQVEY
jgi:hypothetical protein